MTNVVLLPLFALFRVPNVVIVNGLDLTWKPSLYQRVVRWSIPRAKRVLAISAATAEVARSRGVEDDQLTVIRLAVDAPEVNEHDRRVAHAELHRRLGVSNDDVLTVTIGRLVPRKGARWYVREVMPKLPTKVHYVIAGSGPDRDAIVDAVANAGLADRVHLLGLIPDDDREMLFRGADMFVQPNIPVLGDMEGFGLVVVEAAKRGTVVVASALEGIRDAVIDGETGILCESGDTNGWCETIGELAANPAKLEKLGLQFQVRARQEFALTTLKAQLDRQLQLAVAQHN
jgi:glycosyltransferase involved in cell wall biosynthesis